MSREGGGFIGSIRRAEELAEATEGAFLPRQFSNEDNIEAHYRTTGPEIWWQLRFRSLYPNAFVAGVDQLPFLLFCALTSSTTQSASWKEMDRFITRRYRDAVEQSESTTEEGDDRHDGHSF